VILPARMERIARDKHSSLFGLFVSDEEKKVFKPLTRDRHWPLHHPRSLGYPHQPRNRSATGPSGLSLTKNLFYFVVIDDLSR
jgi:hypothetical protein